MKTYKQFVEEINENHIIIEEDIMNAIKKVFTGVKLIPALSRLAKATNDADLPTVKQETEHILNKMELKGEAREKKKKELWASMAKSTKNKTMSGILKKLSESKDSE